MFTPSRILIPVDGSSLDEEMVDLACYLGKRSRVRLYAVHVIEVKRTLPLEIDLPAEVEKGEQILQRVEEVAHRWKQQIETEVLQARDAGTAIVEEAERRDIDLIILGLKHKTRFDLACLGATVNHVIKNAACRVWVCEEPIPAAPSGSARG